MKIAAVIFTVICTVGEVYVFGRGTYGQLGLGEEKTADMDEPVHLTSIKDTCVSVEAASSVSFAVSNNGKVQKQGH